MNQSIVLKQNPRIEFQLMDHGFQVIDQQTSDNSGFYPYQELESVELNNAWFPRVAKILRVVTWILNGVPYMADEQSCKKANVIIRFKKGMLGMWLTDSKMTDQAKNLKEKLEDRFKLN